MAVTKGKTVLRACYMHVEKYHSHAGSIGINGTVGVIRTRVPTTSQLIQQGVAHEVLATFSGEGPRGRRLPY
jgi:hypothetical protein